MDPTQHHKLDGSTSIIASYSPGPARRGSRPGQGSTVHGPFALTSTGNPPTDNGRAWMGLLPVGDPTKPSSVGPTPDERDYPNLTAWLQGVVGTSEHTIFAQWGQRTTPGNLRALSTLALPFSPLCTLTHHFPANARWFGSSSDRSFGELSKAGNRARSMQEACESPARHAGRRRKTADIFIP